MLCLSFLSPQKMRPVIIVIGVGIVCIWLTLSVVWLIIAAHRDRHSVDDDYVLSSPSESVVPTRVPSPPVATPCPAPFEPQSPAPRQCHVAQAQAHGVADEFGRACDRAELLDATNCCPPWSPLYSCTGCENRCCAEYHRCVSCCMGRTNKSFHVCSSQCRTSSRSLNKHGKYADKERRFCWASQVHPKKSPARPNPSVQWLKLTP